MTYDLTKITAVFDGRDGDATKALYAALQERGMIGSLVVNLLRAEKNSGLAKGYRRGSSTSKAYQTKGWAMDNLCTILSKAENHGHGIVWGWQVDEAKRKAGSPHADVLYVETPFGQASFHNEYRGQGPDYAKPWDGLPGASRVRILAWANRLLNPHLVGRPMETAPKDGTTIIVSVMGYSGVPNKGHYAFERVSWRATKFSDWDNPPAWHPIGNDCMTYGGESSFLQWWPDGTPEECMERWPQTNFRWVPSNGTGGMMFQEEWCDRCMRDKKYREDLDRNPDTADGADGCDILSRTMVFDIDHPNYPNEWTRDDKGQPICKAFEQDRGQAEPRCTQTADLFGEKGR